MTNPITKTILFEHEKTLVARVETKDFILGSKNTIIHHEFWNDKDAFEESLKGVQLEGNPAYDHVKVRNEFNLTDEEAISIFKQLHNI